MGLAAILQYGSPGSRVLCLLTVLPQQHDPTGWVTLHGRAMLWWPCSLGGISTSMTWAALWQSLGVGQSFGWITVSSVVTVVCTSWAVVTGMGFTWPGSRCQGWPLYRVTAKLGTPSVGVRPAMW
jgi:hypothetical protein